VNLVILEAFFSLFLCMRGFQSFCVSMLVAGVFVMDM